MWFLRTNVKLQKKVGHDWECSWKTISHEALISELYVDVCIIDFSIFSYLKYFTEKIVPKGELESWYGIFKQINWEGFPWFWEVRAFNKWKIWIRHFWILNSYGNDFPERSWRHGAKAHSKAMKSSLMWWSMTVKMRDWSLPEKGECLSL